MRHRTISPFTIAVVYAGLMALSLYLTLTFRYPNGLPAEETLRHWQHFGVVFVFWLVVYFSLGLFEIERVRGARFLLWALLGGAVLNFMVAALYFYAQPELLITPRRFLLALVSLQTAFLLVVNVIFLWYLRKFSKRLLGAFGQENFSGDVKNLVNQFGHLGFVYGGREAEGVKPWDLLLFPSFSLLNPEQLTRLYQLRSMGLTCVPFSVFYEQHHRKVYLPEVKEGWLLEGVSVNQGIGYRAIKRVLDIVIGLPAFLVFVITYPLIALLIKLDSSGPVLFWQKRIGFRGQTFALPKYRTMRHDSAHDLWTQTGDSRVTRVGKFLRRLRLDELPQSLLILRGTMSLVGPRPEQVHIVEMLRQQIPFYDERHWAKPGLAGWAQLHVYAASVEESQEKLAYDLYYLKHQSAGLDAEVILKTIWRVLIGNSP